jgi:putative ABC transport system permease protein
MTQTPLIDLSTTDLAFSFGMVLLTAGLAKLASIGREKELLWAAVRMVTQLIAVGFLLRLVFALGHPVPILLIVLAMGGFAMQIMGGRIKMRLPGLHRILGLSLLFGCGGVTLYLGLLVVQPSPWYDPRYLLPLASMIIGNSMNGASLAAERFLAEMRQRREEIETALCLGAGSAMAAAPALRLSFRAALIPITNTMAATGIVTLPGMMSGQILSGTDPLIAVKYQIAIMCALVASVAATSFLVLVQCRRACFTPAHQLRLEVFDHS